MNALFLLLGTVQGQALGADTTSYSGVDGALQVAPPRVESAVEVDGVLDEPVWARAARLVDFSQYSPADGQPARDPTEILIWYSPTAIHFGVRAHAQQGAVRAHLTDRDEGIISDDYIEIHLGTYNDGRQVFVFAANPFGVQADGALLEGSRRRFPGFERDLSGREQADLSPDYTFDSKGRVTDYGYEVEIRIPFKSLRYRSDERQDWSLQVIRKSAASGREDTWAPARRAASSFVAQAGTLVGLERLSRGRVLEVNPIVTSTVEGGPESGGPGGWTYSGGRPEVGGNLKWGLNTNLTLNGTVNPDFSQVESDAGQVTSDPRRALFFAEKRPFFLDGQEYFTTPSRVIYTRRIGAPIAAAKLTGKLAGTSFGFLSAVDGKSASFSTRDNPVYNVLRIQRDIGGQSRLGFAYTDRIEGTDYNRVAQVDGRLVLGPVQRVSFHGAVSRTRTDGVATTAPMWSANFNHSGRTAGLSANFRGISNEFVAASGFISQSDLAETSLTPSLTLYGGPGAFVQRFSASVFAQLAWTYTGFEAGASPLDRRLLLRTNSTFRGGWDVGLTFYQNHYGYDERLYRGYAIEIPTAQGADTVPYAPARGIPSLALSFTIQTPEVAGFILGSYVALGRDLNYDEFAPAQVRLGRVTLGFRPTQKLRFESQLPFSVYRRSSDGSVVARTLIPRLKIEYQVSRAVFLRVVGQYSSFKRDSLRDVTRTELPILIGGRRAEAVELNDFELDFLFSYQPTPGTLLFLGYGSTMAEDRAFRFRGLGRTSDFFFTKLSYLFRL